MSVPVPDVATFIAVSEQVMKKALTPEEGVSQIRGLNFLGFDIDDIKHVQDADWLPDDVSVDIVKPWMRQQDTVLLELRAFLVLTPTIDKARLNQFTQAIRRPADEPDLTIENIIYKIATAGGSRAPVNPYQKGLITCNSMSEMPEHKVCDLFSFEPGKYYMSGSAAGQSITVSLPSFLKAQVTAYTLGAPPKNGRKVEGGMSSWILQGSDDVLMRTSTVTIQQQTDNRDLQMGGSEKTFQVETANIGFYRHFHLKHTGQNHQGNFSMFLSKFDITGKLLICK